MAKAPPLCQADLRIRRDPWTQFPFYSRAFPCRRQRHRVGPVGSPGDLDRSGEGLQVVGQAGLDHPNQASLGFVQWAGAIHLTIGEAF